MDLDTFEIRRTVLEFRESLRRRWWMVPATCALTVGMVLAFIYYFPPVYKSGVKVLIQKEDSAVLAQFYDRWNLFRPVREAKTEADIITTAPVAEAVVDKLNLKYDDVFHPVLKTVVDIWKESYIGSNYRRIKYAIFPMKPGPYELSEEELERAKTIDCFKSGIDIEAETNSDVATVIVLGPSPRVAEMANTLIDEYLRQRDERRQETALAAYHALVPQVDRAKEQLTAAELQLQAFMDDHNVRFEFDKEKNDVLIWAERENTLLETKAKIAEAEKRLAEIERQLLKEPETETTTREQTLNELKKTMRTQLLEYQLKLTDLGTRYAQDSPEVMEVRENIRQIEERLRTTDDFLLSSTVDAANPVRNDLRIERSRVRVNLAELKALEKEQRENVAQYAEKLQDLPGKQRQLAQLTREVSVLEKSYKDLQEKKDQAYVSGVADLKEADTISVVERAVVPDKPSRPITKLYLLAALLAGVFMGSVAAFVAGFFDDTIRPTDDLEAMLGSPVYGAIRLDGGG